MSYTIGDLERFVEECQEKYARFGIDFSDPTLESHEAHHPFPRGMGEKIVKLLLEDHAVHGVIQSEVFQKPCVYGWEKKYLSGELLSLFSKWQREKAKMRNSHPRTKEARSRNGAVMGRTRGKENGGKAKEERKGIFDEEFRNSKEYKEMLKRNSSFIAGHNSIPVECVETGEVFTSSREASRVKSVSRPGINACCKGTQMTAGGFHWRVVDKTGDP